MSLFDSASLVVTPNGYKEDKLYSIKPTDGSGDLVVTRATTATRVNSAGLIEQVPYNLLLNSLALAANYSFNQCSITSTQVAPNGSNNAKRITNGSTVTDTYFEQSVSFTTGTYTWSVFVKQGTAASATIKPVHVGLGADVSLMTFTFATETITSSGSISSTGFEKLSNGWYRIFCSVVIPSSVSSLRGRFGNPNVANVYNDWAFPQLVTGTSAKEYFPTTDRLNVPRIDYTNGSCPSILVEPQRTNSTLYSEDLSNVNWVKDGFTISANAATSPDGTTSADKLVSSAASGNKIIYQIITTSIGTSYTTSAYFKASEYNLAFIRLGGVTGNPYVIYNLSTQAVVSSSGSITHTIQLINNGWYKITVTVSATSVIIAPVFSFLPTTGYTLDGSNVPQYTGNGVNGGFVWGAQLEAGSYPTSYIPTVASSVTRNADVISKTGISSLIGQTEGTMYINFYYELENKITNGNDKSIMTIRQNGSGYNNEIALFYYGDEGSTFGKTMSVSVSVGGVVQCILKTPQNLTSGYYKVAFAYKQNDFVFYVNGVQIATDSSSNVPTCNELTFTDSLRITSPNAPKEAILFKTRLTNAELAELTTL